MSRWLLARALLLSGALAASVLFALGSARAELTQRALTVGRLALDFPEEWLTAAPRTLWINGAQVRIVTGRSELPLHALLARLEASCRARSRLLGAPWRAKLGEAGIPAWLDGVLRVESEHEGVVGCLDPGDRPLGAWGLLEKLERFAAKLDLDALGAVRLVRVEAREQGSFFVAALSEGPLALTTMFPESGDAPGVDLASAGRPRGSRRLFTALQQGGEPTLTVYEVQEELAVVLPAFEQQLERRGFVRLARVDGEDGCSSLFGAHGQQLLVSASRHFDTTTLAISSLTRAFPRNSTSAPTDTGAVTRQAR
jgi:hypothetical protein